MSAGSLRALAAVMLAAGALVGCGGPGATVPAWTRSVVGGECDLAVALDLQLLDTRRESPVMLVHGLMTVVPFHAIMRRRIEGCVNLVPGSGEPKSWLVIVHDIPPKADSDLVASKAATPLPRGGYVLGDEGGPARLWMLGDTWLVASQSLSPQLRALSPGDVTSRVSLPGGTISSVVLQGAAADRIEHEWGGGHGKYSELAKGFRFARLDVRVRGERLVAIGRVRYESAERAEAVTAALASAWTRVAVAQADHQELSSYSLESDLATLGAGSTFETEREGSEVVVTVAFPDPSSGRERSESAHDTSGRGKEVVPATQVPSVAPSNYQPTCGPGQRYDLDARRCVVAP
ncbi:MAG: hypothetical protein QOI41_7828 [Myxococcales bacterium]|nr:hypothetical protein [Myxococcales bacterium]